MLSFYEMLQVSPHATGIVIRAAYRCLAQHFHPDKNPDSAEAAQKMMKLNRAYAVLSDLEKRQAYDLSQGVVQPACERRGFGFVGVSRRASGSNAGFTARPFAFRPLG